MRHLAACITCHQSKEETEFELRSDTGKRRNECKPCKRERHRRNAKKRYAANPEKHRAAVKRYAKRHPDRIKERDKENYDATKSRERSYNWRKNNPERWREYSNQWRRDNIERTRLYKENRRRTKDFLAYEWEQILRADPCSYCDQSAGTIDHITPLIEGGEDTWTNLTSACSRCNSRKGKLSLLDFLGRL